MPDPNMEKMDQLIRKLVRSKMDDGQLDDSPLTMRDLDRICKAFLTVLTGVFHQRVEYPKVEIPHKGGIQPAQESEKAENHEKDGAKAEEAVHEEAEQMEKRPAAPDMTVEDKTEEEHDA